MHPENAFYGHRYVLADEIGCDDEVPRYATHIQHGWAPFSPVSHPERETPRLPFLAWSDHDVAAARRMGVDAVPMGAPMAYLARSLERSAGPPPRPGDGSMLVYPAHSWERERLQGSHTGMVDEVRDRAEGPVTICLYWLEFRDRSIRRTYEEAGFRVVSHGLRGDPGFLWRQHAEIVRHDVVATNEIATAFWYGGLLGRDLTYFGPTFSYLGEDFRSRWAEHQRVRWPEVVDRVLPGAAARELAGTELGVAHLREPDELRELTRARPGGVAPAERGLATSAHLVRRGFAIVRNRVATDPVYDDVMTYMADFDPDGDAGPSARDPGAEARRKPRGHAS